MCHEYTTLWTPVASGLRSLSPRALNFLLTGGLFLLWHELPHRPTREADQLGFGTADVDSVVAVFRQVCAVACDDGMRFDTCSIRGEVIRKQAGYGGVRIEIQAAPAVRYSQSRG
ncbi:MAG: nucleotidyl transferase AbiEii/AbiGii toxin family protein [Rhodanobacter sp.]